MRTKRNNHFNGNRQYRSNGINLFSESALIVLVSIVTLFLQSISFATTYSGSKVYLEGVFLFAPLLFALAIQLTAYFLSNSLRTRITFFRVVAMCVAMSCSTYYSYIGIYNSVNSPASYLQENYMRISDELTRIQDTALENSLSDLRLTIGDAYAKVNAKHSSLLSTRQNIDACLEALSDIGTDYSQGLRAPKRSEYETYEEYAAAYQAYIAARSAGSKTEKETTRQEILSSYGFANMEALNSAKLTSSADVSAMYAALGISADASSDFASILNALYMDVASAVDNAALGQPLNDISLRNLTCLLQAAMLYSDVTYDPAALTNSLDLCAKSATVTAITPYQTLVESLPEKMVTTGNLMTLKSNMDSQIVTAIINLNSVLPQNEQLSTADARFQIMALYLIPVRALTEDNTKTTALFCLGVAALIDVLSILFAISVRKKKPIWKKAFLLSQNPENYMPQICAALPGDQPPASALSAFLSWFYPSPETECDGYMMQADMRDLEGFYPLIALLCQINLAKVVPAEFFHNDSEIVLLRARFTFWANNLIYEVTT